MWTCGNIAKRTSSSSEVNVKCHEVQEVEAPEVLVEQYRAFLPLWVAVSVVLSLAALVVVLLVQLQVLSVVYLEEAAVPCLVLAGAAEGSILTGMLVELSKQS
jgi:hypothetical protein